MQSNELSTAVTAEHGTVAHRMIQQVITLLTAEPNEIMSYGLSTEKYLEREVLKVKAGSGKTIEITVRPN